MEKIFIVGMGCTYSEAQNLQQFWETVLTQRCGFRTFPSQRLSLAEYSSANLHERDKTYIQRAAFIHGFNFDWKQQRIPKPTFEVTDPTHWLALNTAIAAIDDAKIDLDAIGRDRIGVIIGNSLTGEISRAQMLRLRWPYFRNAVVTAARSNGMDDAILTKLILETEQNFKAAFPIPNEDTLAGVLSNVIAGRICNFLDLGGGGYTIDGACASSLLAVSNACEALTMHRLDLVIAGGVDISLDPLEMVGFARTGALTSDDMRVYDRHATGFLPGEGCGMVVLMREADIIRFGLTPWAQVAGWGISSDGAGGVTAPKASAQALAMRRCYELCGFSAASLDFIEGHGTGTPVGDREELQGFMEAISKSLIEDNTATLRRTGVTSIKTLLGHTKAAAGAAGLIKAVLAVNQRVLPPLAGLQTPATAFDTPGASIYPLLQGQCVPDTTVLRAGVSGAGFGGINCHVAVTGEGTVKRSLSIKEAQFLLASAQRAELFVTSDHNSAGLIAKLENLLNLTDGMAEAELVDLAAWWAVQDTGDKLRAAIVAATVAQLHSRIKSLIPILKSASNVASQASLPVGIQLAIANPKLRIGYLLPGQGSQFLNMGGKLSHRFGWAAIRQARWEQQFATVETKALSEYINNPIERANNPEIIANWNSALANTKIAQPAIVMTELQWLQWLGQIGIIPNAVAGHSLGEISALVAAGMLSEVEAIEIVLLRARQCARSDLPPGGMLALQCGVQMAQTLLATTSQYAVVANDNAPNQAVIAGAPLALAEIKALAQARGIKTFDLKVSQAFHSQFMQPASQALGKLAQVRGEVRTGRIPFYSAMYGGLAPRDFDPFFYVEEQVAAPVRFREAILEMAKSCDICIEIGPGSVLSGLARSNLNNTMPVCALEPGVGNTDAEFCTAIGELFVNGANIDWRAFYAGRFFRPFVPAAALKFIENPCSNTSTNLASELIVPSNVLTAPTTVVRVEPASVIDSDHDIADLIRRLVATESGYDLDTISFDANLSRDLRLDSIKIAEIRAQLHNQGINLPEGFPLGQVPIREIARIAIKEQKSEADIADTEAKLQYYPMPKDLPILGFSLEFQPSASIIQSLLHHHEQLLEPIVIIHGRKRTEDAKRLSEQLLASGIPARIDDGTQQLQIPETAPIRLIALPGGRIAADRITEFFAKVSAKVAAGVAAVVLIARDDLAPVFSFAQSLALEMPGLPILGIEVTAMTNLLPLATAAVDPGVKLFKVTANDVMQKLTLTPWQPSIPSSIPLQPRDLVVISGGAKGITAECTIALLQATGARAILLGTTAEKLKNTEVSTTLQRIQDIGLEATYLSCDVTSQYAVRTALQLGVERFKANLSDIKGLIHGAGINIPTPVTNLSAATLMREYTIKVSGLNNLIHAIGADNLNLCVGLGSVIGVVGMHRNSGYALANEAMAATLIELKRDYPHLQVACPAYSVWDTVGMGAKLDVIHTLAQQHISAIPIATGTRWFLDCCGQPNIPIPLVITGSMHGLATWRQLRGTDSAVTLPYLTEHRIVHEPNLIVVTRPLLSPPHESWILDHSFRGTLLFATVQALNYVGSSAYLLTANHSVVTRFTNLHITRPVIIVQHGTTMLEVDVRRNDTGWTGNVGTPGSAWSEPAFSMQCQLGSADNGTISSTQVQTTDDHWQAVASEVSNQLYAWLLFQGPTFQRIRELTALDLHDPIRRRGRFVLHRQRVESPAPLPDIYFLDAMLQTVQILVPQDVCLPTSIEEIIFYIAAWEAGLANVEAVILGRTANGYITQVSAWDAANGALIASIYGYRVNIVTTNTARADAPALFEPLKHDQETVTRWLQTYTQITSLNIQLGSIANNEPVARRATAAAQLASQLNSSAEGIIWDQDGAPRFLQQPQLGLAIAHDGTRLLTACGNGRIGCDIQRVSRNRVWSEILPAARISLWHDLTKYFHDPDIAGAVVWAIHEALIKVKDSTAKVTLIDKQDGPPQFHCSNGGVLIAGIVELVLAGPTGIALVQLPHIITQQITHYSRDLEITFKEALPPLRSPTASVYFSWMGTLREEAMSSIRRELAQAFAHQNKGMVTNATRVHINYPIDFTATLHAWVWLNQVLASSPSTFELGFQWAEMGPNALPLRIVAQGLQRLTWVNVEAGGHVSIESFPEFFANFIANRLPAVGAKPFMPPLGYLLETDSAELPLWRRATNSDMDFATAHLTLHTDNTHSNFVGNIYFSHVATLAERACHQVWQQINSNVHDLYATNLNLSHVGEAMPGDVLKSVAQLVELGTKFCTFDITVLNTSQANMLIATGRARFRLFSTTGADAMALVMPKMMVNL